MLVAILAASLSIGVSPAVCNIPCHTTVTVRVENAHEGDKVVVTIDGQGGVFQSLVNMDEGRRTYQLPAYTLHDSGEWYISAYLYRHGRRGYEEATSRVYVNEP